MRLKRCPKAGVLERVAAELQCEVLPDIDLDALAMDSTIIKFHAHETGAPRNGCYKRLAGLAAA